MNTEKLFQVLSDFHPITENCKEVLKRELQVVAYPKGHYLVQAQSPAQHAYFLQHGFSVSYIYRGGERVVTEFWQAGEIILAPKSFFKHSLTGGIIELTTNSELLSLSYASLNKLFESFPKANNIALAIMAYYHARSEEKIVDLHTLQAPERYIKLLRMYPGIELHVSLDLIASYLNITPSTLSRLRHKRN